MRQATKTSSSKRTVGRPRKVGRPLASTSKSKSKTKSRTTTTRRARFTTNADSTASPSLKDSTNPVTQERTNPSTTTSSSASTTGRSTDSRSVHLEVSHIPVQDDVHTYHDSDISPAQPRSVTTQNTSTTSQQQRQMSTTTFFGFGRMMNHRHFSRINKNMQNDIDTRPEVVLTDDLHTSTGSCSMVYGDCVGDDAQIEPELNKLRNELNRNQQQNTATTNPSNIYNRSTTSSSPNITNIRKFATSMWQESMDRYQPQKQRVDMKDVKQPVSEPHTSLAPDGYAQTQRVMSGSAINNQQMSSMHNVNQQDRERVQHHIDQNIITASQSAPVTPDSATKSFFDNPTYNRPNIGSQQEQQEQNRQNQSRNPEQQQRRTFVSNGSNARYDEPKASKEFNRVYDADSGSKSHFNPASIASVIDTIDRDVTDVKASVTAAASSAVNKINTVADNIQEGTSRRVKEVSRQLNSASDATHRNANPNINDQQSRKM